MYSGLLRHRKFRKGRFSCLVALLILIGLFALVLGHNTPNYVFANTASEEWERVRYNTGLTNPPLFGEHQPDPGSARANRVPYKSIYFPVSGLDDPQCQVSTCAAWDWNNHTRSGSGGFSPTAAPSEPPFVRNMSYIPNFVCYDGNWLQWTAATTSAFQDPIPHGHLVVQAEFVLEGTFVCDYPSTEFNIIFQSDPISVNPLVVTSQDFPQDCSCPVCAQNATYSTFFYPGVGIPSYIYGQQNRFYIIPLNGSMCLNAIELRLYYQPKLPLLTRMSPESGPREGGTVISISLDNFDPNGHYRCRLPLGEIVAVKVPSESRIECTTPNPCAISESKFSFTVFMTENPLVPIGNKIFTAYNQPWLSQVTPTKAYAGENVTLSGGNLASRLDLSFSARVGGVETSQVYNVDAGLVVTIPQGTLTNQDVYVQVSLNGQNWSNATKLFIVEPPSPPKRWYNMPTILYIILGGIAGILLLIVIVIVSYRACKRPKPESTSSDKEPLLGNSFGPKTPSLNKMDLSTISEFEKIDVSKLKLGKRIGKGSFGEVYIGSYLGTEVAVKKILANKISPEFMQEFAREASLMRDLRHPNVVQFIGATMDEPDICIITEYMAKGSLYHLLHDPNVAISWEMVRKIALDAAKGMAYLHLRTPAIIHRDLKSHNLLVDDNWKVKVCDFGLSKIAIDQQATMTACGTPCWTAPEILRNARYTTKADVFSYGIVLWELVTREEPFAGMPAFQVIFAVGTKGARLPLPQVCPPELIKLIVSCWQEDPALRPPFSDVITYLERLSFS